MKNLYISLIKYSLCHVILYRSPLNIFLDIKYSVFLENSVSLFHPCSVNPFCVVLIHGCVVVT